MEETIEELRRTNIKVEVVGIEGYGKKSVFVSKEDIFYHFHGERIINCLVINGRTARGATDRVV